MILDKEELKAKYPYSFCDTYDDVTYRVYYDSVGNHDIVVDNTHKKIPIQALTYNGLVALMYTHIEEKEAADNAMGDDIENEYDMGDVDKSLSDIDGSDFDDDEFDEDAVDPDVIADEGEEEEEDEDDEIEYDDEDDEDEEDEEIDEEEENELVD